MLQFSVLLFMAFLPAKKERQPQHHIHFQQRSRLWSSLRLDAHTAHRRREEPVESIQVIVSCIGDKATRVRTDYLQGKTDYTQLLLTTQAHLSSRSPLPPASYRQFQQYPPSPTSFLHPSSNPLAFHICTSFPSVCKVFFLSERRYRTPGKCIANMQPGVSERSKKMTTKKPSGKQQNGW